MNTVERRLRVSRHEGVHQLIKIIKVIVVFKWSRFVVRKMILEAHFLVAGPRPTNCTSNLFLSNGFLNLWHYRFLDCAVFFQDCLFIFDICDLTYLSWFKYPWKHGCLQVFCLKWPFNSAMHPSIHWVLASVENIFVGCIWYYSKCCFE